MMTADIAQIISQGHARGKTAAEIAEEVAREFDRDDTALSDADDGNHNDRVGHWRAKYREILNENKLLRFQLATAEAAYLQFRTAHDEKLAKAREALEPFAEIAKELFVGLEDDKKNVMHWAVPTVGQFREAGRVYAALKDIT